VVFYALKNKKMLHLTFEYSPYLILPIFLLAAGISFLLYKSSKQPPLLTILLAILRFLSVFFIGILLLSPFLKSISQDIQKPIVAILQDASSSINNTPDNQYLSKIKQLSEELTQQFEVHTYSFGDKIRPEFPDTLEDKTTNISEALEFLYNQYSKRNLGAIILATDGIYNRGIDPLYQQIQLNAPIFTIGLGDTLRKMDLILKNVLHNDLIYLNDRFTVQTDITGYNLSGKKGQLQIYQWKDTKKSLLTSYPFEINASDFFLSAEFILKAEEPGLQKFTFELLPLEGEYSSSNNSRDIYIDVLDSRKKIAILAHAPHPDISALKQSILSTKIYETAIFYAKDLSGFNPKDFDLLILHQLPSNQYPLNDLFENTSKSKLFIAGQFTAYNDLNKRQNMVGISPGNGNQNEVQISLHQNFNLFGIEEAWEKMFAIYPPILAPFATFNLKNNAKVWWHQTIGKIETEYPLLVFEENSQTKNGLLLGEGIWKWRLFDYLQNQNHLIFDGMFSKIVQYLSQKEDKRRLRVALTANTFDENQPVTGDAYLYNKNFELIQSSPIELTLKDESGKMFSFDFIPNSKSFYSLQAGILPKGNYDWIATSTDDGEKLTHSGKFTIKEIQLEENETTANHSILTQLSNQTGGAFFTTNNLEQIPQKINSKPIVFENTKRNSGISMKWIFIFLVLSLSSEWFLRRYNGIY
jgi:hypothetical protein